MFPTLKQHFDASISPKRILAVDGGGLRGVLTLEFLGQIEAEVCRRHGDDNSMRLCDYFDLIGGTSTGAIIAAGLACGMSVNELKALYSEIGQEVFRASWLPSLGLFTPKFPSERVQQALESQLGADTTIGSECVRTGLMIMTKRLDTGSPWPIHNHPGARYGKQDRNLHLAEVVRASTAAPTYFSPERIAITARDGTVIDGAFIDGGVSPFNDPSLQLLAVAALHGHGFRWKTGADNILVISVGTGRFHAMITTDDVMNYTPAKQGLVALQSLMGDCGRANLMILRWLTRCLTSWTIDRALGDMSLDSEGGPQLASYARYDVLLNQEWLRAKLNLNWDADYIEKLSKMDQPSNMPTLAELGRLAASEQFRPEHLPSSFDLSLAH